MSLYYLDGRIKLSDGTIGCICNNSIDDMAAEAPL